MRTLAMAILALAIAACGATPASSPSGSATARPTPPPVAAATATPGSPAAPGPTATDRPTPTPVGGDGQCPAASLLTVAQYTDADPRCFGGADIEIRGWLDEPPGVGFEGPPIEPSWLAYPAPGLPALWTGKPIEPDHICSAPPIPCAWFFLSLDPKSGLDLDIPPREIIVTGHREDPAAATCHFVFPADWTDERPDDSAAVGTCRASFIVTAFRAVP